MGTPLILELIKCMALEESSRGEFAKRWSLLPVYEDMGGTMALDAEGQVFTLVDGEPGPPKLELDEGWRLTALVEAASQFPELAHLKPPPPQDAVTCTTCSGSGFFPLLSFHGLCGQCHGTGWVHPKIRSA